MLTRGKCPYGTSLFAVVSRCDGHTNHAFLTQLTQGITGVALFMLFVVEGSTSANGASDSSSFSKRTAGQQVAEAWPYLLPESAGRGGVKIAFFRHYAIFAQEVSKIVAGTPNASYSPLRASIPGVSATVCKDRQSIDSLHSLQKKPVFPWYKLEEAQINRNLRCSYDCQGLPSTSSGTNGRIC